MKQVKSFFIGWFLCLLGLMMFFSKLTFNDPSNTGFLGDIFGSLFGDTSPKEMSGVLMVVFLVMLVIFAIAPNILTFIGVLLSILVVLFTVISSMSITIASMSGVEIFIISAFIIIGMGIGSKATISLLNFSNTQKKTY